MLNVTLIFKRFGSFIIPLLLTGCLFDPTEDNNIEILNWMSSITGVELPDTLNFSIYNNHEWGVISKFELNLINGVFSKPEHLKYPYDFWNGMLLFDRV